MTPSPGESSRTTMENSGDPLRDSLERKHDTRPILNNLSTTRLRMDTVLRFLSDSVDRNIRISDHQMDIVSSEISTAIHQIIVNGSALVTIAQDPNTPGFMASTTQSNSVSATVKSMTDPKIESMDDTTRSDPCYFDPDSEIVELDAVELMAEHIHFCEICGKGFKRDANLRMHMRAHGNQFKTPEALAKPLDNAAEHKSKRMRFSCPYDGCNRNKTHKKFKPLKSVICVKNHFKRSHCPKMFSCNRCNKKSFSVVADLKSHLKNCGESKWRCSCGTTFSRKDKLFGHIALFEGHMPAVVNDDDGKEKSTTAAAAAPVVILDEDGVGIGNEILKDVDYPVSPNDRSFESFLDGFGSIENQSLQDMLGFPDHLNLDWKFSDF